VPFPVSRFKRSVVGEQTSGEGCSNGRLATLTESKALSFFAA